MKSNKQPARRDRSRRGLRRELQRRRARRYETGVYADEVLQQYFSPSMAVISNIGAG